MKRAFLILPKDTIYDNKSDLDKRDFKKFVDDIIAHMIQLGLTVCCIREDFLAVKLLYDREDIKWFTAVSTIDTKFISSNIADLPLDWYQSNNTNPLSKDLIAQAKTMYKPPKVKASDPNYKMLRFSVFRSRRRFVCDNFLANTDIVFYVEYGTHNYCKFPNSEVIGDGKLRVKYTQNKFRMNFAGGISVEDDVFDEMVRRVW